MVVKDYGSISSQRKLAQHEITVSQEYLISLRNDGNIAKNESAFIFGFYRTSVYFAFYVMFYVVFLTSGAMMFSLLERSSEVALQMRVESVVQNFLRTYPNVSDQALEDLISEVVAASNRGVSATRNATGESNWSFGQSFFFTSTVVTTIGKNSCCSFCSISSEI
ncbi:hypothetical protein HHI36_017625 [Cryptolaemus montrouzieri]|uniref:Uncharacterized protein n=1 Tax=Cryptolaemus montrouzieri TaxID=559131 RepID=A0ABD2NND9_9CUCU